jgi:hypothetical protein
MDTPIKTSLPKTRGECIDGPRPCPHVRCRHHLAEGPLDVDSCSLDVADRGPVNLTEIGRLLGVSRERARQIEAMALGSVNQVATRAAAVTLAQLDEHRREHGRFSYDGGAQ